MAYIGLRKPLVGKLDVTTGKYEAGASCGRAIGVTVTPTYAEGSLYGDDVLAESDKFFTKADLTLNTCEIPLKMNEILFGHKTDEEQKTIDYKADDECNYVGLGLIGVEKVKGVRSYVATFICKAKFADPGTNWTTKGDSITYDTPSMTGTAEALDDGTWKKDKVCATEAEAEKFIKDCFTPGEP